MINSEEVVNPEEILGKAELKLQKQTII